MFLECARAKHLGVNEPLKIQKEEKELSQHRHTDDITVNGKSDLFKLSSFYEQVNPNTSAITSTS